MKAIHLKHTKMPICPKKYLTDYVILTIKALTIE